MSGALVAGAAALRRMLTPATALLAALAGGLAGAAVLGLPDATLAPDVFEALLLVFGALLLLPLAAGLASSERAGGFEQLVAVRPVGSLAWALGRLAGALAGAAMLALLLGACARAVGGQLPVPLETQGVLDDESRAGATWRFELPAGVQGPFELRAEVLPAAPTGGLLSLVVARSDARVELPAVHVTRRSVRLELPDLLPARGDLRVTLAPGPGLLPGSAAPRLVVGRRPLGRGALPLPGAAGAPLLLAVLAALAAGCAFHFETACLAGLLALAVRLPDEPLAWTAAVAGLTALAVLGTALQRRAALP